MVMMKPQQKIKNCSICGKPFVDISGRRLCRDCYAKEEEIATEVIHYVRDHPHATQQEVIEATGATLPLLRQMIREGRFETMEFQVSYPCSVCGAPIVKGKLCIKCTNSMQSRLHRAASAIMAKQKQAELEKARMFVSRLNETNKKNPK